MNKKDRITIVVIKNVNISDEEFESAFNCAVTSVESTLYDYEVEVAVELPNIYISAKTDIERMPFSLKRCKEIIKGAFVDAAGRRYPEFNLIEVTEAERT